LKHDDIFPDPKPDEELVACVGFELNPIRAGRVLAALEMATGKQFFPTDHVNIFRYEAQEILEAARLVDEMFPAEG